MKVFGIGLNKTGTRSLAEAMRTLGYRTLHKGDTATSDLVERAARDGVPLLTYIGERFDAYLDVDAIVHRFAELDQQYPGSKFILTTADEDAWLSSRKKHVEANQERARAGTYEGTWLTVDLDGWRAERLKHHALVESYFRGRDDDLLVFDVRRGDSWELLAPFLGQAPPSEPFPWNNRNGEGTYRAGRRGRAVRRQAIYVRGRIRRWHNERGSASTP